MLRRIGLALAIVLALLVGLWIAALVFLPDAPSVLTRFAPTRFEPEAKVGTVLAVPVAGVPRAAIRDSWGDPRDNGLRAHHGTDVMAAANTPVLAAATGTVEKLWSSAAGGTTVYVRSPEQHWVYYYAHLAAYAAGLREGQRVKAGDVIGYVGDTGNAGAGNYHLHFGLARTTPEQHWYEGRDVDPFPYLAGKPIPY